MKRHPTGDGEATDHQDDTDEPTEDKPLGRDEKVSLYPLDPVEALRALMKTPRKDKRG